MATGVQPAELRGTGVVIRKDGTKVPFEFSAPVAPEQEDAAKNLVAEFNKQMSEEQNDGGNA